MKVELLDKTNVQKTGLKNSDITKLENSFKLPVSFGKKDAVKVNKAVDISKVITDPSNPEFSTEKLTYKTAEGQKGIYLGKEGSKTIDLKDRKKILGGKGAGMAEMIDIGLPVPRFFTITTDVCKEYQKQGKLPEGLLERSMKYIEVLEHQTGKKFDNTDLPLDKEKYPLLVSVRSGAPVSMPGMMDTVLNLGMNDRVTKLIAKKTGDERFAYDSYRRFLGMFGNIVLNLKEKGQNGEEVDVFAKKLDDYKNDKGYGSDTDMTAKDWKKIVKQYKKFIMDKTGKDFQNPKEQLGAAIEAVFKSWNSERAIDYRNKFGISDDLGTAVSVVGMVFGNRNKTSGTGVAFTRDPNTGEKVFYGDFLMQAQGEDVVAGIREPKKIQDLERENPEIYNQLVDAAKRLEAYYGDLQDTEFTIEDNEDGKGPQLYMLQTRTAKRSAHAQIKTAVDFYKEGFIRKEKALNRIEPNRMGERLAAIFDPQEVKKAVVIAEGLKASRGCASGKIVFNAAEAKARGKAGEKVILVRPETSPNDVAGMFESQGIVTTKGGLVSHAAVIAKQAGKPCVITGDITVDLEKEIFTVGDKVYKKDDLISIDGTNGKIYAGKIKTIEAELDDDFKQIMTWAKESKTLQTKANADNRKDALKALELGAEGVGLCRTEHMFMEEERLPIFREMIMAQNSDARKAALDKLLPIQKKDFTELLETMDGKSVTIRLLDPPLHEFLPNHDELIKEVTELKVKGNNPKLLQQKEALLKVVEDHKEFNPMLGTRGCRLGIQHPEISEMQIKAIIGAACDLKKKGLNPKPEIMIPLTISEKELETCKKQVEEVAAKVMKEEGVKVDYKFGTMIETPAACLIAGKLAKMCDFFSFGTNDLTQTTLGMSRDDVAPLINIYKEKKIMESDPFDTIDTDRVGKLMKYAVKEAKKANPRIKIGICGEHGGEDLSVKFCDEIGMDSVSSSPYRVPTSIVAAGQSGLKLKALRAKEAEEERINAEASRYNGVA